MAGGEFYRLPLTHTRVNILICDISEELQQRLIKLEAEKKIRVEKKKVEELTMKLKSRDAEIIGLKASFKKQTDALS